MDACRCAVLATAVLALGVPAGASAASLRLDEGKHSASLLYTAAPAEANDVSIIFTSPSKVTVTEAGRGVSIKASDSCEQLKAGTWQCAAGHRIEEVSARLGDGPDRASVDGVAGRVVLVDLDGGLAADELGVAGAAAEIVGDAGDDRLTGGDFGDRLDGGPGSDTLSGGGGDDAIDGGPGAEPDAVDGGLGNDTVDYSVHRRAVEVDLAAGRGGAEGENDQLAGVESAVGSRFDDALSGDDNANTLFGGPGGDALLGAGGDDTLDGGPGADQLYGGDGGDLIDSFEPPRRDRPDVVGCGADADVVIVVRSGGGRASRDLVTTDCEFVDAGVLHRSLIAIPPQPIVHGHAELALPCRTGLIHCEGRLVATAEGRVVARGHHRLAPGRRTTVRAKLTRAGRRLTRGGGAIPIRMRVAVSYIRPSNGRPAHSEGSVLLLVPLS